MKNFKSLKGNVTLAALVFLLGTVLGVFGAQKAAPADTGSMTAPNAITAPPAKMVVNYVQVPDLIGKTKGEAEKALKKAGLKSGKVQDQTVGKGKIGTVVKQHPTAKTRVVERSTVDLWILKGAAKVTPKIVQKSEKVFMEFPETVKDVTISDEKGNKLQQFKQGKRFDITESVLKTKAGRIKVAWKASLPDKLYTPGPPPGGTAADIKHTANFDASRFLNENALRQKGMVRAEKTPGKIPKLNIDDTFIENGEPGNNTIFYTLPGPKLYSGTVGAPGDPVDRLAFNSGPSPDGTVITVHVVSGNVNVTLYYGALLMANPLVENGNGFWIAVRPSDYIYFSVQPTGAGGVTPYTISVSRQYILNPNEAQQTENNPMQLHLGGGSREGALAPRFGESDYEDWFFVQAPQNPSRLRIRVTDAGMAPGNTLKISLVCTHPSCAGVEFENSVGTNSETTLETGQPYSGMWKIRVSIGGLGTVFWGTENIPSCYRKKPYKIRVEAIP